MLHTADRILCKDMRFYLPINSLSEINNQNKHLLLQRCNKTFRGFLSASIEKSCSDSAGLHLLDCKQPWYEIHICQMNLM